MIGGLRNVTPVLADWSPRARVDHQ